MNIPILKTSPNLKEKLQALEQARDIVVIGPFAHEKMFESLNALAMDQKYFWVFIDGGALFLEKLKARFFITKNFLILGDGDSLGINSSVSLESFDILLHPDKDQSDLEYFLNLSILEVKNLTLLGFSGGEIDHELANVGVLFKFLNGAEYADREIKIQVDQHFYYQKSTANKQYLSQFEFSGGFSLFSLEKQPINLRGNIKFEGEFTLMPLSSHAISNKAQGKFVVTHPKPILIIKNKRS